MKITQDTAAERYQLACDALMEIAQDYQVSNNTAEIALQAANKITLQYIDNAIDDINQLNSQYKQFIHYMKSVIADLENTLIDDALVVPLQNLLKK
jgi:hypothetical protein